ncbi:pseudouridine synthase [Granulosicoccus antarcticus]|uniref:Ribosomal large subunit pseudouridine synthase A n=1 Tax=Granulosicoccus antarcticus IMCC3135 TaxID=1192854 RepID=A0A2Z2NWP9_9GAMM|nr:pseudouridine synthase [Granulosicoccus antarcticus]ASJ73270.1 Ribosomal large subunit pseudouridine synthase A [Granulosicoccus antarcticus IMCC3135]
MAISEYPSKLSLPQTNPGVATVLEYLIIKFPYIDADIWHQRINDGKVHRDDGSLITAQSPFQPQQRIHYYREVESEPSIPFKEIILFQDQDILVAYKPHFLAVIPGGIYVNECLQNRLRRSTGIDDLQALHRLDRVTAGLVIFSVNPDTRHHYHELFKTRNIHKTYQAVAKVKDTENLVGQQWEIKNRLVQSKPRFCMRVTEGEANSHSVIRCLQQTDDKALFELNPVTGRTHQLRVHMHTLGWPLLNDKYYPQLQPLSADNYSQPLQLLSKALQFIDPVSQQARSFEYAESLSLSL